MSFNIKNPQPAVIRPQSQIFARPVFSPQTQTKSVQFSNNSSQTVKTKGQATVSSPMLGAVFGTIPVQAFQAAKFIAGNISDFSDSVRAQRQEDQKQGKGLIQGARDFSSDVSAFYEFLGKVDSSKLNRDQIVPQVGSLAQELMQQEAGKQIVSAARELFPETTQEIETFLSAGSVTAATQSGTAIAKETIASSTGTLGSIGRQVLGWAGAAYSLYEIFKGKLDPASAAFGGATAGAYIGSAILPGVGTAIGAVVGGIGGFLSGMFKSAKPAEQKERDAVRKQLLAAGILDNNWNIALANGGSFDFGKDGGAILANKDGGERKYKEFDTSNPLTQPVAQIAAPLAQQISGGNARLAQELTAYFTNAATSNTDSVQGALQNLQVIYAKFGIPIERVLQGLAQQGQLVRQAT